MDRDIRDGASTAVAALRRLFVHRPSALLSDVDGTISRLTSQPADASVSPAARESLVRLSRQLNVVAVVTGRAVARAQTIVGVSEIDYVGNHGFEWSHAGTVETLPEGLAARPALEAALESIRSTVPGPGIVVEDKGVTVAVHYRLTQDPPATRERMLAAISPWLTGGQLRLIEGGLVFNLLPAVRMDKGRAVIRLVGRHGLRSVAFFGDDVTDLDAFRTLRELRAAGRVETLAVGVLSPEGPPQIRELADLLLDGVDEVEEVLAALASGPVG